MSHGTLAVYGATGYTGKLIVAELRRRGVEDVVLSGRRADALQAVAEANGYEGSVVRAASHDDATALRAALDGVSAVIAAAGPFSEVGDGIAAAAAATGTHYVDTTGEQPFMRRVLDVHGPVAEKNGAALVSGMGFDYVTGDLLCAIACEGIEEVELLRLAYAMKGFGATRGTLRSALLMMRGGDVVYQQGQFRDIGLKQPRGERFDFGPGFGDQPVARYPSGEILTVPRHVNVRTIESRITAATFAPHPRLAASVPVTMPLTARIMRTPLRGLAAKAIDRLPEGPPLEERRAAKYAIVAEATPAGGGAMQRATLHGTDVYGITAVTTVEGAIRMTEDGYDKAGGLAPAQAYDARSFLDALGEHGVTYDAPVPAVA
ncbi:MAG: saccharopine dehydrogenase NADP-binding domain-containing protein [Solirubrobacteraceae bacterium]|nr:saccharopine dehydrogenase NADP-binding domain-containing protein [Solirubrobacteraceae bacterium]